MASFKTAHDGIDCGAKARRDARVAPSIILNILDFVAHVRAGFEAEADLGAWDEIHVPGGIQEVVNDSITQLALGGFFLLPARGDVGGTQCSPRVGSLDLFFVFCGGPRAPRGRSPLSQDFGLPRLNGEN